MITEITPVFVELIPRDLEQGKLYISEKHKCAIHLCACGCGERTVTPLLGGDMWDLEKNEDGTVSLIGSVGNYQAFCKSHYSITSNKVIFVP